MSAITIDGDLVHYEKLGRGRPVILVHGWIGSWRYWIPLMSKLHTSFSVYTLDLIGFGDSSKTEANYTVAAQVRMLEKFTDQLGIPKVALIGHGLGAMVATQFALKNPTKTVRMMLTSIPLFDPGDLSDRTPAGTRKLLTGNRSRHSLAPQLEDNNNEVTVPNARGHLSDGNLYTPFHELPTINRPNEIDRDALRRAAEERDKAKNRPNLLNEVFKGNTITNLLEKTFKRNEPEFDKLKTDVDKCDNKVLEKSAEGYSAADMLDDLRRITSPVLAIHGMSDPIIPSPSEEIWNYLTLEKEDIFVPIPLPNVRHFPMLEHEAYSQLAVDFLNTADISKIEVRERWKRRNR